MDKLFVLICGEGLKLEERFLLLNSFLMRNQLRHKAVNKELMEDCITKSGIKDLDEAGAATVILNELWNKLRSTHKLKIVK
jgi:hypothetical protein